MEQDYMKKDLRDNGIEVIVPEKDDRDLIAKRILEELELGIVKVYYTFLLVGLSLNVFARMYSFPLLFG